MKLLFVFLLLLSLGLFAFMQWGGALTGSAKNGQTLAELNPEKIRLLDKPLAKTIPASAVPSVSPAVAASAPLAASAPVPAPVVSLPVTPVAIIAVSGPAAASLPLPAPAPVVAPVAVPPPVPAPILAPAPVTAHAGKSVVRTCMEWGEFSGTDLAFATKELAGLKLGERLTQRTVEYASGYWVYIPPLRSQTAVNKKIEQIKAIGVQDYYVVKEPGKWMRAISLGVFKTQEAAKNFQNKLKKKGLSTAKVGERKHKLKFIVFAFKSIDAEERSKLLKLQKDIANSELKAVACK